MHAASTTLHTLDTVYHGALRFISNAKSRTHHCRLYEMTGLSSLGLRRWLHWHIFIYKAINGNLPSSRASLLTWNYSIYNLRSVNTLALNIPHITTEFGKTAFSYAAPWCWYLLQKVLKLSVFIPLGHFKQLLKQSKSEQCTCF